VSGDNTTVIANDIISPVLYCYLIAGAPSTLPPIISNIRVTNNGCDGTDRTNTQKGGISLRNVQTGTVSGNTIRNTYMGLELYGFAGTAGARDISVTGNSFITNVIGIWFRKKTQYSNATGNVIQAATQGITFDNASFSFDSSGSFPSFHNTIGTNSFDTVTTQIDEIAGDFETVFPQDVVQGTVSQVLLGAHTIMSPPNQFVPIATVLGGSPDPTVFRGCIQISGSTTTNISACSDGTNWRWVKDNSIPTT